MIDRNRVMSDHVASGGDAMQISRRDVLSAGATVVGAALTATETFGGWEPSERYPDPAIKALDTSFLKYRVFAAGVERLFAGARWSEGPVWFGDARCVLWSDIPNNRILRWDEETGRTTVYRKPSNYANGNTRDRQGRLITCEHDARRVTRTEYDGTVTVLIDKFDGKPLNSPNDVVVKSDGSIWLTDPTPGIAGTYEGHVAQQELPTNVYRLDPISINREPRVGEQKDRLRARGGPPSPRTGIGGQSAPPLAAARQG
jgi:gluconolactonase